MHWFLKLLINPLLDALGPRVIVEIGVEVGAVSIPLLRWAQANGATLHAIDPDPTLSVDRLEAEDGEQLRFHRRRSLEALAEIAAIDLALIDGDHNWYTVINELRTLEAQAREEGREPPVMLLHDVGWPYGRRDLYYEASSIPEAHRQPHARGGLKPGRAELGPGLNDHLQNAQLEGTPANGVLSAVEDFIAQSKRVWRMWQIPGLSGMAILASEPVLDANTALCELLDSIESPGFLRAQCEAIEESRIDAELKRANISRRLAETQLKQVMRSRDPRAQVRVLESEVARLRSAAMATDARVEPGTPAEPDTPPERDTRAEREAWSTLLAEYVPLLEGALPCAEERDPLSLPCPLDVRGILREAGAEQAPGEPGVDVVVCVHDALAEVRECLSSLLTMSDRPLRLILVNDGSEEPTTHFLRAFADRHPAVTLIHRETPPHGYTVAANHGIEAAEGDYVVLLNSDTVVTDGWLGRIVACGESHAEVGILGVLSNAASHQSVPLVREGSAWARNPLPAWLTVAGMGVVVAEGMPGAATPLPFLNGFCYTIKRAVIEAVGLLDEERFAAGYCEENDYSLRARAAGFGLAVVSDAYVHHAKSRPYGVEAREELARASYAAFLEKHGREEVEARVTKMEVDEGLQKVLAAGTGGR